MKPNFEYFISNETLSNCLFQLAYLPFLIVVEEIESNGRPIKWVKVNSENKTFQELPRYSRWIRVLTAIVFFIPTVLLLNIYGCAAKFAKLIGYEIFPILTKKEDLNIALYNQNVATYASQFKLAVLGNSETIQIPTKTNNPLSDPPAKTCRILDLAEEVLCNIVKLAIVHNVKERAKLSKVCRSFYRICNDYTIWNSLLSPLGVRVTSQCFANDRNHIICRYDLLQKSSVELQSLFSQPEDFLKLPFVYLPHQVDYSVFPFSLQKEQQALENLSSWTLQVAKQQKRSKIITGRGWMGLFLHCNVKGQKLDDNFSDFYLCFWQGNNVFEQKDFAGNLYAFSPSSNFYKTFTVSFLGDYNANLAFVNKLLRGEMCTLDIYPSLSFWKKVSIQIKLIPATLEPESI